MSCSLFTKRLEASCPSMELQVHGWRHHLLSAIDRASSSSTSWHGDDMGHTPIQKANYARGVDASHSSGTKADVLSIRPSSWRLVARGHGTPQAPSSQANVRSRAWRRRRPSQEKALPGWSEAAPGFARRRLQSTSTLLACKVQALWRGSPWGQGSIIRWTGFTVTGLLNEVSQGQVVQSLLNEVSPLRLFVQGLVRRLLRGLLLLLLYFVF